MELVGLRYQRRVVIYQTVLPKKVDVFFAGRPSFTPLFRFPLTEEESKGEADFIDAADRLSNLLNTTQLVFFDFGPETYN